MSANTKKFNLITNLCFLAIGSTIFYPLSFLQAVASEITPTNKTTTSLAIFFMIIVSKFSGVFYFHRFSYNTKALLFTALNSLSAGLLLVADTWEKGGGKVVSNFSALFLAAYAIGLGEVTNLSMVASYHDSASRYYSSGTGVSGLFGALIPLLFLQLHFSFCTQLLFLFPFLGVFLAAHFVLQSRTPLREPSSHSSSKELTLTEKKQLLLKELRFFVLCEFSVYCCYSLTVAGVRGSLNTTVAANKTLDRLLYFATRFSVFLTRNAPHVFTFERVAVFPVCVFTSFVGAVLIVVFRLHPYLLLLPFLTTGLAYGASNAYVVLLVKKRFQGRRKAFAVGFESASTQLGSFCGSLLGAGLEAVLGHKAGLDV